MRKVTFTGSTSTGAESRARAADHARHGELGGKGPIIVMRTRMSGARLTASFAGFGSRSAVVQRRDSIHIHDDIYQQISARHRRDSSFQDRRSADDATQVGSIISKEQLARRRYVALARSTAGGKV